MKILLNLQLVYSNVDVHNKVCLIMVCWSHLGGAIASY